MESWDTARPARRAVKRAPEPGLAGGAPVPVRWQSDAGEAHDAFVVMLESR
jgi:hypothetical protein